MPDGYLSLHISVDALEWTAHWLGRRRCDLLSVSLAEGSDVTPRVRIVAVESKGRSDTELIEPRLNASPFDEAVTQVTATLDALDEVLCPDAQASVVADLKLSALVEHLTSETLARLSPIVTNEPHKLFVLSVLSSLSRRQYQCGSEISLEGLAVVTQRNASVQTQEQRVLVEGSRRQWPVRLVRCGVPLIRQLLEEPDAIGTVRSVAPGPAIPEEVKAQATVETREVSLSSDEGAEVAMVAGTGELPPLDQRSLERLTQLEAACRLRGFRIGEILPELATSGPTLISVSVELAAGESIRPIQGALSDIARELGVPSIGVENDPERPYHLRFLIPRAARQFPGVPPNSPVVFEATLEQYSGIWLGAGVDGHPSRSFVSQWPHLLVAGTTGSGKTTFLKSVLQQLNDTPVGDITLVVVDGKGEYDYMDVVRREHFPLEFDDVLLGYDRAIDVLQWLVDSEVARRRDALRAYFGAHRDAPRAPRQAYIRARAQGDNFPIAPIVVVIDEFAEIMLSAGPSARRFEDLIQRVVQAGRSALVHLLLATQRPDANVLPGAIKANMPSRIALSLPSHHDSMTVLNSPGAEDLLGSGDLIFQSSTGERLRLQGYKPTI